MAFQYFAQGWVYWLLQPRGRGEGFAYLAWHKGRYGEGHMCKGINDNRRCMSFWRYGPR